MPIYVNRYKGIRAVLVSRPNSISAGESSLTNEVLHLEVSDYALEVASLLQGEEEGGDIVV